MKTKIKTKQEQRLFMQGSATVEASVIIPFILVIFAMIISAAFFLYNECSAWQCSYLAVLRADTATGQIRQKEFWAEYFAKKLFTEELMAAEDIEFVQIKQGDKLTVQAKGNVSSMALPEFGSKNWHFETTGTVELLRPVQFIRRMQLGEELKEKITGHIWEGGVQEDGS